MSGDVKKFRRLKAVSERRQQEGIDKVLAGVLDAAREGDMALGAAIDELRGLWVAMDARLKTLEANDARQKRASGIITLNQN